MDDDDDNFMGDFDPFDLLQEHNLLINRIIKAHNSGEKVVSALVKQNQELTNALVHTNTRIDNLEKLIRRLNAIQ